ncbi:Rpn family recombination-promoting nuclease/putative transposase [Cohnella herbarum]|uniref:Transposase n=1 Tax=Cohnella herbarum TaxID=2728023 RepID=A0A7Z2ZN65_9BACL|nr:Rpn family recombination-promoting nuclease/putative transposase [Cohnella herbarum]QJD85535.1 transposase [Cohnella herbarum]
MDIDHDRLYKVLLQTFFQEFVELFFPEAAVAIDFTHVKFLSEEIFTDLTGGQRGRVDLLVETKLKGEDALILIHFEPQSYYEREFAERMFIYASRLYEKYRRRIVPIAIFSHERKKREPDTFSWEFSFLDVLKFRYFSLQLKHQDWRKYVQTNNPVAAALLSSMGYDKRDRTELYGSFLRIMLDLKFDPARMRLLTVFFESYMQLSASEENLAYSEFIKQYPQEEGTLMEWLTSHEKKGFQKGLIEGKIEGKIQGEIEGKKKQLENVVFRMLQEGLPLELITKVTGLPEPEIEKLQSSH